MANSLELSTHIFISYSSKNTRYLSKLIKALTEAKRSTWVDRYNIDPGAVWSDAIDRAIRSAAAVVVILTPDAARSKYVTYEWSFALGAGVKVIPVVFEPTSKHPKLATIQHRDFPKGQKQWKNFVRLFSLSLKNPQERMASQPRSAPVPQLHPGPEIIAMFELDNGEPVVVDGHYSIQIGIRNAPSNTTKVKYTILDDSFDDNPFTVDRADPNFTEWMTSYGNVYILAEGQPRKLGWKAEGLLSRALQAGHGQNPTQAVRKAIRAIEAN